MKIFTTRALKVASSNFEPNALQSYFAQYQFLDWKNSNQNGKKSTKVDKIIVIGPSYNFDDQLVVK